MRARLRWDLKRICPYLWALTVPLWNLLRLGYSFNKSRLNVLPMMLQNGLVVQYHWIICSCKTGGNELQQLNRFSKLVTTSWVNTNKSPGQNLNSACNYHRPYPQDFSDHDFFLLSDLWNWFIIKTVFFLHAWITLVSPLLHKPMKNNTEAWSYQLLTTYKRGLISEVCSDGPLGLHELGQNKFSPDAAVRLG